MLESVASASSSNRKLANWRLSLGSNVKSWASIGNCVLDDRQRTEFGVGVRDRDIFAIDQGHGDQRIADVKVAVGADRDHGAHRTRHDDVGERPARRNADFLDRVSTGQKAREYLGVGKRPVGIVVQEDVGRLKVGAGVEREVLARRWELRP